MAENAPPTASPEHESIGQRIRYWRRRRGGMSQQLLADLAGLSQGYVSQIESGQRPLDRKSTQVAFATALNITVAQLFGHPDDTADPVRVAALRHIPAIRSTLVELSAREPRPPRREPDQLRTAVRELTALRNASDYGAIVPALPGLLSDLAGHGSRLGPELVETLFCARFTLKSMGLPDLAREAAELGVRAAEEYDDAAWIGQARYSWVQAFPPENAALGRRITARAAEELQAASGRDGQEVYGCLHLLSAFQSAIALRADDARTHLAEAADIARSLGEPEPYGPLSAGINANWFGPTQVDYWRVAVAAELGDPGAALAVSKTIDLDAVPLPNRHVYFHTDMARALAAGGKDREAMFALSRAEQSAPQHFRFNPVVRNLVTTLIERAKRRAVGREMAALARKLGIHPI